MDGKSLVLAPILGDGMILQRDVCNRIYGKDYFSDTVTVCFLNQEYRTLVNENAEFNIELPPFPAGGPYQMGIKGSSEIILSDIWFGDVFILSGQSNMELPVRRVLDVSGEEIKNTHEPEIRQYLIPATYNFSEPEEFMYAGSWKKAAGEELMGFSALGYFFAKEIKDTHKVPVGLIQTAVGGSTIEAWMKPDTLKRFGDYEEAIGAFKDPDYFNAYILKQQNNANEWLNSLEEEEKEFSEDEDYKKWNTCNIPSLVSDYGEESFSGSVYLCREVILDSVPETSEGSGVSEGSVASGGPEASLDSEAPVDSETLYNPATWDTFIYMGSIIDSDKVWINGVLVGRTEYRYPPRKYKIPKNVLKKGSNLIVVRLVINHNNGGTIKDKPYYLCCNKQKYNLEGKWFYRIGKRAESEMPQVLFPPILPTCFYNTAVVPLSRLSVKGILWYQGESNTEIPEKYSEKFAAMVADWRTLYGWEIPFVYVQLAGYREPLDKRADTGWAYLRDEQRKNLSINNTAMAVILDIGESNDLHFQNKKEAGLRLAKAAGHLIYHRKEAFSGPIPNEAHREGKLVKISFFYLEEENKECKLNLFELAGADGIYYKAEAVRKGSNVFLSNDRIAEPVKVRYAWCDDPQGINFYNEAGLPAAGFQMDIQMDNY